MDGAVDVFVQRLPLTIAMFAPLDVRQFSERWVQRGVCVHGDVFAHPTVQ